MNRALCAVHVAVRQAPPDGGLLMVVDEMQLELEELGRRLKGDDRNACVRVLAVRMEDGWQLRHCWALVGAEPPDWKALTWRYTDILLLAAQVPAATLAAVCTGGNLLVGGFEISVPAPVGPGNGERRPSFHPHDRPPLPVPVTDWRIASAEPGRQLPQQRCIGEGDSPSFWEPNSACHDFFEGDFGSSRTQGSPSDLGLLRIVERDARLGGVTITATQMTVEVLGEDAGGAELELFGVEDRQVTSVHAAGAVTLALPRGLPSGAWLWLRRDGDWLDYRTLDPRLGAGDLKAAGVEIEAPVDPQSIVEALLAAGEGPRVEYKECLPSAKGRRTLKSVAAFANGDGGSIVFGVNRDEVTIVGVEETQPATKLRDELVNLVRGSIAPMPQVHAQHHWIDERLLLVLTVQPGQSPPYALSLPAARDKPEFFVRRGASTYHALPSDLREAILSRTPPAAAEPQWSPFSRWR